MSSAANVINVIYVIHGSNVHEWWLHPVSGSSGWWKHTSSFCQAIRTVFAGSQTEIRTHEWTGKNSHADRLEAAQKLASKIRKECGNEQVHLVGHSHGGNVALLTANLLPPGSIHTIVLLANPNIAVLYRKPQACDISLESGDPHAEGCSGSTVAATHWMYWGQAQRKVSGLIWNLYSPQDIVQCHVAGLFHGVSVPATSRAARVSISVERTCGTQKSGIRNGEIWWNKTSAGAHSAMHSAKMGTAVANLLQGREFAEAMSAADLRIKKRNPIRDAGAYYTLAEATGIIRERFQSRAVPFSVGKGHNVGVLLIHGFTASTTETRPLAEYINKKHPDWQCEGILLPGHGTAPESLETTDGSKWLSKAEHAYLKLSERYGHVFLAGMSMGALLCCHIAIRNAHHLKIRGLVLMAPAFRLPAKQRWALKVAQHFARFTRKSSSTANYFVEKELFSYTKIPLKRARDVVRLGEEALRRLGDLKSHNIPVLMFAGSKDDTVSLQNIKDAARHHSWIEFHELEESRHILTVEPDKQEVLDKTMKFMEAKLVSKEHSASMHR